MIAMKRSVVGSGPMWAPRGTHVFFFFCTVKKQKKRKRRHRHTRKLALKQVGDERGLARGVLSQQQDHRLTEQKKRKKKEALEQTASTEGNVAVTLASKSESSGHRQRRTARNEAVREETNRKQNKQSDEIRPHTRNQLQ